MSRPKVIVTRRWHPDVEAVLTERYDTQLNEDDQPMSVAELQDALRNADAVLPTVGVLLSTDVTPALLAVLLPAAFWTRRRLFEGLRTQLVPGFCLAVGIALYTEGIVRGEVARVILLFYLTPVWSTLLSRIVLGNPITGRRLTTILLGLAGMLVIFGAGGGIPRPVASADWMVGRSGRPTSQLQSQRLIAYAASCW